VSKTTGLNNTTVLSRSGVVLGLNKSITIKKKMHRIVPTILEQSRVISKGKGYDEKLNRRKAVIYSQIQSSKVAGRTSGSNNLSAKNINEKKYLSRVTGMALTNAQKKKLAKK